MDSIDRRRYLSVLAVAPLAGCLDYFEDDEEITDPPDVEIVYDDLIRENPGTDDERVLIWGVVRNVGDRELRYIEIRATFFDAAGEELDRVIGNVGRDVSVGTEWPFEIEYPQFGDRAAAVDDYELEPVTGV